MKYFLTVVSPDGTVLFAGNTRDPDELDRCAREARRLRPTATIYLRAPNGSVETWPAASDQL